MGAALGYTVDQEARLTFALSSLWNVEDRSAAVTPTLSYDFGQSTSVSFGTLQSFGSTPTVAPAALRSEFGTYGDLWFVRLSVYL